MLKLSAAAAAAMRAHAEEGYPLEICGFLVGEAAGDTCVAREAWPVRNTWEEDPEQRAAMAAALEAAGGAATAEGWESASSERRFLVSPQDFLKSEKRARAAGMSVVGLYHTHPEHPAVPSDFDRDAAWPEWSYVILSVRGGAVAELRSAVLDEAERRFSGGIVEEG
ncbi:MAG TPA: M67 family metallopeptidase [Armatimonadota bacterium]|nr:M67 family metallopeptidase [Armatimonadota bacterium]